MNLLLLRHGKAEERRPAGGTDFSRALVEKGHQQAREAARVLSAAEMLPDLVLCSPLVRTRQTADAFTMAARLPGAISQSWLSAGMNPVRAVTELAGFRDFETVMLVGHEPDFSQFIEYALGAAGDCIEVRKGSVTCLEINPPFRQAVLRFLLPFKLAKHLE
ncbi:SixA phosphatase family protein [Luteolibacter algae]|uniref:SixA phosphatase family protein n=1 Tax=Luteolibacter algae TaxID=454151 RepID=A0ABW5D6X3_9BACT